MRHSLPPLRLLTTFEAVLRTGGVQNAATELNVTQPAVSKRCAPWKIISARACLIAASVPPR